MGILDIVILAIALILAVVGIFKGFVKGFLGTIGGIVALVAAYFLCGYVADWIAGTGVGNNIIASIQSWFTDKAPEFAIKVETITNEMLVEGLKQLGIPSFLHAIIIGLVDVSEVHNISVAAYLSPKIAGIAFNGIAYTLVFLGARLVIFIIQKIFSKLVQLSALGAIDRLFGFVWGVVKAGIIVSVIFLVLSLVSTLPFMESVNGWILTDIEKPIGIAKYLYTNNPLIWLYEKIVLKK